MKGKKGIKQCLALLLALAMFVSGLTIPERKAAASEETPAAIDATEVDDISVEGVVQIGEQGYATFSEAVEVANASEEDVTIKLIDNISISSQLTINNENGKNITIDGQNGDDRYTLTSSTRINLEQSEGTVTIQNLDIIHSGSAALLRIGSSFDEEKDVKVILCNMDIQSRSTYRYFLIGTQDLGNVDIDMEQVNVTWTGDYNDTTRAFLRLSNTGKSQTVNIDMTGCTIDVSGTTCTQGMYICEGADATVSNYEDVILITPSGIGGYTHEAKTEDGWKQALEFANASKEDVTIRVMDNIDTDEASTFNNTSGKKITINGQDKTLTLKNRLDVQQQNGVITLQDLIVKHSGAQMFMRIGSNSDTDKSQENITVNLNNVDIDSESTNSYCLIGTQDQKTFNVNMKGVTVDWDHATDKNNRAFIRCGISTSNNLSQALNLTMEDCTIDVAGAGTTKGMHVLATVNGKVDLKNTKIITKNVDAYTILGTEALLFTADEACVFTREVSTTDYFTSAVGVANTSAVDVTIKLIDNISISSQLTIDNENGKNITIDGQNGDDRYTLTSSTRINLEQSEGTVTIQNLDIIHSGSAALLRIGSSFDEEKDVKVILCNMDIQSGSTYQYFLIGTQDLGNVDIDMKQVNVTWTGDHDDTTRAFLRLSNPGKSQTVNIDMTGCTIDVSGTTCTQGVYINNSVTGTINFVDTDIITPGAAKYTNKGSVTITEDEDCTLTYVYKAGTADEFTTAVTAANASAENVMIKLLADIELTDYITINNANGKNIAIDGTNDDERYKLTITTTSHSIRVHQTSGTITFQNINIVHGGTKMLLRIGENKYTEEFAKQVTVNLTNMDITSTSTYEWCLIATQDLGQFDINMTNVNVDWNGDDTAHASRAFLRCGDGTNKQIVNLIANGCTIDVSDTTQTQGMYILNGVSGTFEFNDSEIIVPGKNIYTNNGSVQIDVDDKCNGIPDGCVWKYKQYDNVTAFRTSKGFEAPSTVPTGYIFAGWYTDESCAAEYALAEDDITTTSAYAKFVPEHVIEVKAQISANLLDGVSDGEKGAIRFVTTVDSLDYQEIGFDYEITNAGTALLSGTKKSNIVYKILFAVGEKSGESLNYTPWFAFCEESEYFKAVTFKNISSTLFDAEITVRPFWITLDGTKVYGEAVTKTVNQGIENADEDGKVSESESTESVYANRVVLVSDMHYTTNLDKETYDSQNPSSIATYAAGLAFGYTQEEKLQAILDDINGLGATKTINSVMVLGDVTLDNYGYSNLVDNYLDDFKLNFMNVLTASNYSVHAIAGNHDSYTNDEWKEVIGTDRQYSVEIGDAVFIMLDTFEATHATSSSGSAYKGVDVDFLKKELANEAYVDKIIFLCAHYYQEGKDSTNDAALKELIVNDRRIVCMFRGHTHMNTTLTPSSLAGIPLIDIGGYAYNGQQEDNGTYNFNIFDESWAWGYQVLEWNDEEVHLYHVKSARNYTDSDGVVHEYEGAIEDDIVIKLK